MQRGYKLELRIQQKAGIHGGRLPEPATIRQTYNKLNAKHLIDLKDVKQFISDSPKINKFFTKRRLIEINNAIYLMKKRFVSYVEPESNNQLLTVFNSNTINKNRLMEMLSYFVGPMMAKMAMAMVEHGKNDEEIFKFIKANIQYSDSIQAKVYRMGKITDAIYQAVEPKTGFNLLDIGVGNGKKTLQMREMLNCNVFGADIEEWGPYKNKKFKFPYKQIQLTPYNIPYPSNTFDCITMILVLHHVGDMIEVINECKRLLKPNGVIALVEHDVWSDETNMLIDAQHRIYKELYDEQTDYHGRYYNFYEWDILFAKCGMHSVSMDYLTDDASNFQRYDMQYIAIYKAE